MERIAEADLPEADEAGISALLARCFEGFGGRSHYLIRHDWRHVIREEGGIIAHLAVQLRAMRLGGRLITVAGIADVATDPDHRGKGHAAKLLRDAIAQAGQARAEFVLLFGTARIYAAAGFRPVANPIIWVAMPGAVTGEIRRAPAEALMVLPLQGTAWDEAAELDLLGPLF
ncbi:GNAT family N-acetyltransferase [Pseudogemmobacter sonorensis]|uniref:GNAT family N-acetyltransferase n=1 Tax=Pseudogemmobacter sonorensis TaxID=2989681 RepID=UPI00368E3607